MNWYDPMTKKVLANACLHGMMKEYRTFLENLSFLSFANLMEVARCTNESVRRTSRSRYVAPPSLIAQPSLKKRLITTLEKDKRVKAFTSKKPAYGRRETRQYVLLPPFLCRAKKVAALFDQ